LPDKRFNISYLIGLGLCSSDFIQQANQKYKYAPSYTSYQHELQPILDPAIEFRYHINSSIAATLVTGIKILSYGFL
jgi:hypothetical protein